MIVTVNCIFYYNITVVIFCAFLVFKNGFYIMIPYVLKSEIEQQTHCQLK